MVYIGVYMGMCICVYIYIYIYRRSKSKRPSRALTTASDFALYKTFVHSKAFLR